LFNFQSASNNQASSHCTEGEEKEEKHTLFTTNHLASKQMALSKPTFNKFCTCFNQFQSSKRFFAFVQSNNNTTSAALKKSRHFQFKSNTPIIRLLATESKGPKSSILLSPIVTKDRLILLVFGVLIVGCLFGWEGYNNQNRLNTQQIHELHSIVLKAEEKNPYPPNPPPAAYPQNQGYPPAHSGYPPQHAGGYPSAAGGYPPQAAGGYPPSTGGYPPATGGYPPSTGAYPPSASPYPQAPTAAPGYPQRHPTPAGQHGAYPPAGPPPPYAPRGHPTGAYPAYPGASPYPQQQQPRHMGVRPPTAGGTYDAAARFGAGASYNIPPPPPGCAPNSAQMAQMQGQNVVMNQRKSDFWNGSGSGGATWW